MARYIGSKCRICRREATKLFLKGDKCFSNKCALENRNYIPGQHGQRRRKVSDYAVHLREKQKVKRTYGLLEKQFRNYFELAERMNGATGENLLVLLERRLDNVVYRLGFGASRAESRQMVSHRHIMVNGRNVNLASFLVKPGDEIAMATSAREHLRVKAALEGDSRRSVPPWMTLDAPHFRGIYQSNPQRSDLPADINENLIVELYSK